MPLQCRAAKPDDADVMARLLNAIIAIGGTTAHRRPFDEQGVVRGFISPKLSIGCFVVTDGPRLLGFQALEWSDPAWPGDDPLPADWAVIATFVNPCSQRRGVGRALFERTMRMAEEAGVRFVDATIRKENAGGLAYYRAMGFQVYRDGVATVSMRLAPSSATAV